ncbi:hypothetical protein COEX109129_42510 [Corallococcus exiguus]
MAAMSGGSKRDSPGRASRRARCRSPTAANTPPQMTIQSRSSRNRFVSTSAAASRCMPQRPASM